jgi:hypothetical protein
MIYKWKDGARFPVKAQVAGRELERIERETGARPKPATVVEAARAVDSPLHDCFEWDDTIAAQRHREEQARSLIRHIVYVRQSDDGQKTFEVQAYIHVDHKLDGPCYARSVEVMNDEDLRKQALASAFSLLRGIQQRYAHLSELRAIFDAIEATMKEVDAKKSPRKRQQASAT